jgi:hypothetical protein
MKKKDAFGKEDFCFILSLYEHAGWQAEKGAGAQSSAHGAQSSDRASFIHMHLIP